MYLLFTRALSGKVIGCRYDLLHFTISIRGRGTPLSELAGAHLTAH